MVTFFTTKVDVCTGSFCFCWTAIVVEAYRREIFEPVELFSRWIDLLFRCLLLKAQLLFALSNRFTEFRRFLAITDAEPPDPVVTVAVGVVVVVMVLDEELVLSPLINFNSRVLLKCVVAWVPTTAPPPPSPAFTTECAPPPPADASFTLVELLFATNRGKTAVVTEDSAAKLFLLLILLWLL